MVTFEEGRDLEYKMAVELVPDIGTPDFGQVELEKPVADVPDQEVEDGGQAARRIRARRSRRRTKRTSRWSATG